MQSELMLICDTPGLERTAEQIMSLMNKRIILRKEINKELMEWNIFKQTKRDDRDINFQIKNIIKENHKQLREKIRNDLLKASKEQIEIIIKIGLVPRPEQNNDYFQENDVLL